MRDYPFGYTEASFSTPDHAYAEGDSVAGVDISTWQDLTPQQRQVDLSHQRTPYDDRAPEVCPVGYREDYRAGYRDAWNASGITAETS